jgi:isopenicillin-N epimerase
MDFYLSQMEPALDHAMSVLAKFVKADARDMAFVDNATVAMNIVAENVPLQAGDEVLLNDHEYGAVFRIWRQKCEQVGARVLTARIGGQPSADVASEGNIPAQSLRLTTTDEIIDPIMRAVTDRTKLIVVSHVTSPTGIVFPVDEICRRAKIVGVPVCIDGPHAIAMRDLNLREIGCDFYCASLHKWLSAPCGSGFLYVKRSRQQAIKPHMASWGRSLSGRPERWQDHLNWLGTRDPAPFLAVPAAIAFLEQVGLNEFRRTTHQLAQLAREKLEDLFQSPALVPDSIDWYGTMIAVPLPVSDYKKPRPNAMHPLQQSLRERYRIEVPIPEFRGQFLLRVSCHLYNTADDIDYLVKTLAALLK